MTRANLDQKSYAAFGKMDIKLADCWTFDAAVGYTEETKEAREYRSRRLKAVCADCSI